VSLSRLLSSKPTSPYFIVNAFLFFCLHIPQLFSKDFFFRTGMDFCFNKKSKKKMKVRSHAGTLSVPLKIIEKQLFLFRENPSVPRKHIEKRM